MSQKSFEVLMSLAETGLANAQYEVGMAFYRGESVAKDLDKALEYLSKAAGQGHEEAFNAIVSIKHGKNTDTSKVNTISEYFNKAKGLLRKKAFMIIITIGLVLTVSIALIFSISRNQNSPENVVKNYVKAVKKMDLEMLASTIYPEGSAPYYEFLDDNDSKDYFEGYKDLKINSFDIVNEKSDFIYSAVNVSFTYELLGIIDTEEIDLDIYMQKDGGDWYLTSDITLFALFGTAGTSSLPHKNVLDAENEVQDTDITAVNNNDKETIIDDVLAPIITGVYDESLLSSDAKLWTPQVAVVTDNIDTELKTDIRYFKFDGVTELEKLSEVVCEITAGQNVIIEYSATDMAGNETSTTITINVRDDLSPTIRGISDESVFSSEAKLWLPKKAEVNDNMDSDLVVSVKYFNLDRSTEFDTLSDARTALTNGYDLLLTYCVKDESGNTTSKTVVVSVVDKTPLECFVIREGVLEYSDECEKDVVIPRIVEGELVTSVHFSGMQLTSVVIPDSVTTIGDNAFRLNRLANVSIPASVTTIGDGAFYKNQLSTLVIPDSVTTIGKDAFYKNQLSTVVISDTAATIGDSAFYRNQLGTVIIPDSVATIGKDAFSYNQLSTVVISDTATTIGSQAFFNNKLTSITIPDSVTTIGDRAFASNQLTSASIPTSVTTIGDGAFYKNQLSTVVIPNSVTTMGNYAFWENQLTSVVIPERVTTIGYSAFSDNQLSSVVIPDSVTSIGDNAFRFNQLTSISIPASVTTIGDGAFSNNQLTSVTIEGNSTRFSENWEMIGFPTALKPNN
ncbi:leucine-rich repeat protein [Mycoplasmatota bacterium zrk1]